MGIEYSTEGFITYLTINTVGNSKRGFYGSQYKREKSPITITDDNMQDQHCSCITGYDYINVQLTSLI